MTKEKKELTLGERAVNWAKVLAVALPAMVAMYAGFFKGEPDAELAYEKLAEQMNDLREEMNKEKAFMHGFLEGQGQHIAALHKEMPKVEPKSEPRPVVKKEERKPPVKLKPLAKAIRPRSKGGKPLPCPVGTIDMVGVCVPPSEWEPYKPRPKAKVDPMMMIRKYVKKGFPRWDPQMRRAALRLIRRAEKEEWSLPKFLNAIMKVEKKLQSKRKYLPKTLQQLKNDKQQVQQQFTPPPIEEKRK